MIKLGQTEKGLVGLNWGKDQYSRLGKRFAQQIGKINCSVDWENKS